MVRTVDLASESPVTAARAGSLERAWQLAERPHRDDRSLWYLLLAWDLRARGHHAESDRTLDRLLRGKPSEIPTGEWMDEQNWRNTAAITILGMLAEQPSPLVSRAAEALLRKFHQDKALASERPTYIPDRNQKLVDDSIECAVTGDIAGARHSLNQIQLDGHGYRIDAYRCAVHEVRTRGHESEAVDLVAEMLRPVDDAEELVLHRIRACAELSALLDKRTALDLLAELTSTAAAVEDPQHRFRACRAIALATFAVTGTHDIPTLVTTVMGGPHKGAETTIASALCPELAAAGQVPAALDLIAKMPNELFWEHFANDAYAAMARSLASRGDLDGAQELTERIHIPGYERTVEGEAIQARADAFAGLVVGAVKAGETERAHAAYHEIYRYGSGMEGDLDRWHAAAQEALHALVPHDLMRGISGRLSWHHGILSADAINGLDAASDAVAAGDFSDAVDALMRVEAPAWRAVGLSHLATRYAPRQCVELAFESAASESWWPLRLHAYGEVAKAAKVLQNNEVTDRLMTAIDRISVDLATGESGHLLRVLDSALGIGDLKRLPRLVAAAADQPESACGLCVLLVEHRRLSAEKILPMIWRQA
ncbi:hypothetical protein [Lentzea atacamensis]|uniref:hypothetical protein n=1 Tax=Lentzea atacamensis TaxID=531938 RepID=UPI0011BDF34A|nr:hypothetical protein [Lentzea atacamensis]